MSAGAGIVAKGVVADPNVITEFARLPTELNRDRKRSSRMSATVFVRMDGFDWFS
jgi:hypothetical protein